MTARELYQIPGRRQSLVVQVEVSPAYEFFLSLCVFSDSDSLWQPYEIGKAWFEAIRNKLSPVLLETIEHFSFQSHEMREHISALGYTCPPPRDVPNVIYAAAQGDGEAQSKLLRTSFPDDARWQRTLRWMLSLDATVAKERLLDIVHGWYNEVFREQEPQLLPILARDVEAKRALQATHSPEQLIEMCTGWEYVPEPGIRSVMLIPSYVTRPINFDAESGDTRLFFYPAADESLLADASAPPAHVLRLAKALGDERRLRILKMLSSGSYTLQEMADAFGVAKATLHHHLIQLRSAGLVRMRMSDKRFSLRQYPIDHLGEWLRRYLGAPSQEE